MKLFRRSLSSLALGLLFALSMSAPAATPAQAAASKVFYVDDDPANNGSVKCPNPVGDEIEDAIDAFNGANDNLTINVCPGSYTPSGAYEFSGYTNLKITGLGSPVINASNWVFIVVDSTNVTVQGLVIDGQGKLADDHTAIAYFGSSGVVQGNTILGWHETYPATPTVPVPLSNRISSIVVSGVQAGKTVSVLKNTIYDSQDFGIVVGSSDGAVKVSGNRVVFSSAVVPVDSGIGIRIQAGIAVVFNSGPGVTISGNQVTSDADLYPQNAGYARGILLFQASGAKVTGNTVRGTYAQISIENWCTNGFPSANGNVISGNRLYDTYNTGIYITARTDVKTNCGEPHADNNQITKNTIYTLDLNPADNAYGNLYGIYMETQKGTAPGALDGVIANTVISGNTIAGFGMKSPDQRTIAIGGTQNVIGIAGTKNKYLAVPPTGIYK